MSEIKSDSSMQFVAMKLHAECDIEPVLDWMQGSGSSVVLTWGEDNSVWECSWITGGERFTGFSQCVRYSILGALNNAFARFGTPDAAQSQYGSQG